jgi:glutamate--cysteine ligase
VRFREFLESGRAGLAPVFGDWADHLTTIFTDARLKQHIELRGADCNNLEMTLALQALWKGLLYDTATLEEALRLAPRLNAADALALRERVARDALAAEHAGVNVLRLARETVALAAEGLARVAPDEVSYLDVLRERVVKEGVCPADILLRNWEGAWHGSMERALLHLRAA